MKTFAISVTIGFLALSASTLRAQTLDELPLRSRVQLVVRDTAHQGPIFATNQFVIGALTRVSSDSVWIRLYGAPEFGVARLSIDQARVSRGKSRVRSAVMSGVGVAMAAVLWQGIRDRSSNSDRQVLVVGGVGFGVGAVIGALSPSERWRRVRK